MLISGSNERIVLISFWVAFVMLINAHSSYSYSTRLLRFARNDDRVKYRLPPDILDSLGKRSGLENWIPEDGRNFTCCSMQHNSLKHFTIYNDS